jgi:hypothetical protein
VKDEEGFLAEFVAYYVVQGVSHVIFYDDNSTTIDKMAYELEPWIKRGYASLRRNWDGYLGSAAVTWGKQMHQKKMMERDCKLTLHKWGYMYHISVDLDEYSVPMHEGISLVDGIHKIFSENPHRGVFNIQKLQFSAHPHILEPLDKLTIEAYQSRYYQQNKFSPRKGVMKKTIYRLQNENYSNDTLKLILECCTFHSCRQGPLKFCWDLHNKEIGKIFNKPWPDPSHVIFHYARSLEKYTLKQRSWNQHIGFNSGYGISKYLERAHGWTFDDRAVRYSCQVRQLLKEVTGDQAFLRNGNWLRHYEVKKSKKRSKPVNPYLHRDMYIS